MPRIQWVYANSANCCPAPPKKAKGKQLKSIIDQYVAAATTHECHCTGNPLTLIASGLRRAAIHHPLQAAALAFTAVATSPLDETGLGEAADDAEESVFAASDAASDSVAVIGRQADTAVAKDWAGHEVLDTPNWSPEINDEWIGVASRGLDVYTASPTTAENLWDAEAGRPTVYAGELSQFIDYGYSCGCDYFVHHEHSRGSHNPSKGYF